MLLKALTEVKGKKKINYIEGICSTESRDVQGEIMKLDGIDLSYVNQRGGIFLNFEHQKAFLIGVIQKAEVRTGGLWIKARLFNTDFAKRCFEFAQEAEEAGTPMGFSIEAPPPIRDPEDDTIISKAKIVAVALTSVPVNGDTRAKISKSLEADLMKAIETEKYSLDFCKEEGDKVKVDWAKTDLENFQKGMIQDAGDAEKVRKNLESNPDHYSEKSINTTSASALMPESLEKKKKELIKSINALHNSKNYTTFTSENVDNLFYLKKHLTATPVAFVKKLKHLEMIKNQTNNEAIEKALGGLGIKIDDTVLKAVELEAPAAVVVEDAPAPVDEAVVSSEDRMLRLEKSISHLTTIVTALITPAEETTAPVVKAIVVDVPAVVVEETPAPVVKAIEETPAPVEKVIEAVPTPNDAVTKSISALTASIGEAFGKLEKRMETIENGGGVVKSVQSTGYVSKSFQDPNAEVVSNERSLSDPAHREEIRKSIETLSGINSVDVSLGEKIDEGLMKAAMDMEMSRDYVPDSLTQKKLLDGAGLKVVA